MAMKENSKKVLNYLKEINGSAVTAADVAEALGLEKRQVDGIFTSFTNEEQFIRRCQKRSILPRETLHEYWVKYEGRPMIVDFLHNYSFVIGEIDKKKISQAGIDVTALRTNALTEMTEEEVNTLIGGTTYEKDFVVD